MNLAPILALSATLLPTPTELPDAKVEAVAHLVEAFMEERGVPGLSIAIVTGGELAWSGGYGLADVENSVPARATTAYRTASIGKPITATAAMQLVEEGKLDLDADIRDLCPAFPAKRWKITPRHLLEHTSGIRHYGGPRDREEQGSSVHYSSVVDALAPFKDDPLLFEPGTQFGYSTYGYGVLGCVIEGAAGVPFLSYMHEHVFEPCGMLATRDDDPSAIIPNRAAKYTLRDGELVNAPLVDMSNRLPAGGYVSTVEDLARFAAAVMSGRLVSRETFQRMVTPGARSSAPPYGLGWGLEPEPWHDDTWIFHGGSSPGASGMLALMPRHAYAVVFLTNLDDLPGRSELAEAITRVVLDFGPPAAK